MSMKDVSDPVSMGNRIYKTKKIIKDAKIMFKNKPGSKKKIRYRNFNVLSEEGKAVKVTLI